MPLDAAPEDIKRAFYELSKKHHPDIGGNVETQQEIAEAYQILKNPDLRKTYNLELERKRNPNLFSQKKYTEADLNTLKEKLNRERQKWRRAA